MAKEKKIRIPLGFGILLLAWRPSVCFLSSPVCLRIASAETRDGQRAVIERKLRQKIEEKKQAHGMKMG